MTELILKAHFVFSGPLLAPKEEQLEVAVSVVKPILIAKMTRHNVGRWCPLFVSFAFFSLYSFNCGKETVVDGLNVNG